MPLDRDERLSFGPFELDGATRTLRRDGHELALRPKTFAVLLHLAEHPGRLVTKDELLQAVWPRVVVTEDSLTRCISEIRTALGAGGDTLIRTMPGQGYRLLPEVRRHRASAAPDGSAPTTSGLGEDETGLLGRDADLAEVRALLGRHAVLTIVGPGGVGKSSLARRLLEPAEPGHAHGRAWVDLAALAPEGDVVTAVAAAVGVPVSGADALAALVMMLRPLRLRMVLDNAEHVAAPLAALVRRVVDAAPGVQIVVTSQQPLGVAAEQVYRLGPLAGPEPGCSAADALASPAVALFLRRARRADAHFGRDDDDGARIAAICRRLDGLPLAIEIAAAHAPALGLAELARALDARFDALAPAGPDAPARQRTLLGAMAWSHALLAPVEQAVFRRLAVFPAGFGLGLARDVVADEALDAWQVARAIAALVERSLLEVRHAGATRYRLLETARAYAEQQLASSGEADTLRARHAHACRRLLDAAVAAAPAESLDRWRADWLPELDNAAAALRWAHDRAPETALAIAVAAAQIVSSEAPRERRRLLDEAEPLVALAGSPALRAAWCLEAAHDRAATHTAQALRLALDADAAFRTLGDRVGLYRALAVRIYCEMGAESASVAAADELRALEDRQWPAPLLSQGANAMACWHSARREFDAAIGWRRRSLQLQERAGSTWRRLVAHANLVDSLLAAGRLDEAVECGEALQAALEGTRYLSALPAARLNLAGALLEQGRAAAARALAAEGWPQALQLGWQPYWADLLALLAALEGRPRASARLRGYADAAYAAIDTAREVNEARAAERAAALAAAAIGDAAFARLRGEGGRLGDGDVAGLAFSEDDAD